MVDYTSSYVYIAKLAVTTSSDTILHLRSIFLRHDILETLVFADGPQYAQQEGFPRFANDGGFVRCTRSPYCPHRNGKAERTVRTVKAVLNNQVDPDGALLANRTTSLECGYSPAEQLMDRQLYALRSKS